jgi:hypothetical protein
VVVVAGLAVVPFVIGVGAYALYLVAAHGVNPFAGILLAAIAATVVCRRRSPPTGPGTW